MERKTAYLFGDTGKDVWQKALKKSEQKREVLPPKFIVSLLS